MVVFGAVGRSCVSDESIILPASVQLLLFRNDNVLPPSVSIFGPFDFKRGSFKALSGKNNHISKLGCHQRM